MVDQRPSTVSKPKLSTAHLSAAAVSLAGMGLASLGPAAAPAAAASHIYCSRTNNAINELCAWGSWHNVTYNDSRNEGGGGVCNDVYNSTYGYIYGACAHNGGAANASVYGLYSHPRCWHAYSGSNFVRCREYW
jgi:hypothetical protein